MDGKIRESGMPEEALWATFFDVEATFDRLGLTADADVVVEFGCGYGTFTLPAARRIRGTVYTYDIDAGMVDDVSAKATLAGLPNVIVSQRDVVGASILLADDIADYCMLFNILHAEQPLKLLAEARRLLRPGAILGVMHWNYDTSTPRGPGMDIRPRPEQVKAWGVEAGFEVSDQIDLPPYHYGFVFRKPSV